jgi:glutamate racemase
MEFMKSKCCNAVVIACNTATAVAAQTMREKYDFPIIGIEPAVKPALSSSHGKRVLVIATPLTVRERKLHSLMERVDNEHLVDLLALPRLVEFAERGEFETKEVYGYLEKELSAYELDQYGELVLGCTHFNYFKDSLRIILPENVKLIDGSAGTIRQLARRTGINPVNTPYNGDMNVDYYYSGRHITEQKELEHISLLHNRLEKMRGIQ